MKKTLFLLGVLGLCSGTVFADASVHKDNYVLTNNVWDFSVADAQTLASTDAFAFTLNLDKPLSDIQSMEFNLMMGTGSEVPATARQSFRIDITSSNIPNPFMTPLILSVTGNMVTAPLDLQISSLTDCRYLVIQVAENVTLSYYDAVADAITTLVTAPLGKGVPATIATASLKFTGSDTTVTELVSWNGVVTTQDIKDYQDYSCYWVDSTGTESLSDIITEADDYKENVTRTFAMNGGELVVDTALPQNTVISTTVSGAGGEVEITENHELNKSNLSAVAGKEIALKGAGDYHLENGLSLGDGIVLAPAWEGTVYTGSVTDGDAVNLNELGNPSSAVQLGESGDASMKSLTADAVGSVTTPGALMLTGGSSIANTLTVQGMLTLGTETAAATLSAAQLGTQGITLGNIASSISAKEMLGDTLNIVMADSTLAKLPAGVTRIMSLENAFDGTTTLNGKTEEVSSDGKMIFTLAWESSLSRAASGYTLNLYANMNTDYLNEKLSQTVPSYSTNGRAGQLILNQAFIGQNPQTNAPDGALASILHAVDAGAVTDRALAAVAGASTAALGQALSGDVARQLRAIRNRCIGSAEALDTVSLDAKSGLSNHPGKYFAWINAEGNRAEQNADGTAAGYTLTSWGGTVGVGMQLNPHLSLGLALTSMYGDLKSDAPDSLDGDMDTAYLSAFARYKSGNWSHVFLGTVGAMEADYKRSAMGYTNNGDTDGTAFGLMYELSRVYTLSRTGSSISPVFNISYRHTEVDAYCERGTDAALNVGEQSLDTVTLGLGARYAAQVGQQTLNRTCALEARALAKCDLGDTQNTAGVGFINTATRANINSAEMGAFGVEIGAGISVPLGSGCIYADGAVELRSDYTNFNASVGYKIQF